MTRLTALCVRGDGTEHSTSTEQQQCRWCAEQAAMAEIEVAEIAAVARHAYAAGRQAADAKAEQWREAFASVGEQWAAVLEHFGLAEDATAADVIELAKRDWTMYPVPDGTAAAKQPSLRQAADEGLVAQNREFRRVLLALFDRLEDRPHLRASITQALEAAHAEQPSEPGEP